MTAPAPSAGPPTLAKALLRRALPDDVTDNILGDLEELFHDRRERRGVPRARRWYRMEALRLTAFGFLLALDALSSIS